MEREVWDLVSALRTDLLELQACWPSVELRGNHDRFESVIGSLLLTLPQLTHALRGPANV